MKKLEVMLFGDDDLFFWFWCDYLIILKNCEFSVRVGEWGKKKYRLKVDFFVVCFWVSFLIVLIRDWLYDWNNLDSVKSVMIMG